MTRFFDFLFVSWYKFWYSFFLLLGLGLVIWACVMVGAHLMDLLRFGHFIGVPGAQVVNEGQMPFIYLVTPDALHSVNSFGPEVDRVGIRWILNFPVSLPLFGWTFVAGFLSIILGARCSDSLEDFRRKMEEDV